jgi:hypothetical protein
MKRYPLEDVGNEPHAFGKWLWNIHNCVNAKLRGQRLRVMPDPPFSEVKAHYLEKAQSPCTKTTFHGWEFLFSIIENHPYSKQSRIGKPIQGAPESDKGLDSLEKNRWNMLSSDERLPFVLEFWKTLPDVLPFPEWKKIWHLCPTDWSNRVSALKTLWSIRCRSERELELLNSTTFHSLCKELRAHRSGCSASKRAKTCRKKRLTTVK